LSTTNTDHGLVNPEDYEPALAEWDEALGSDIETKKLNILKVINKLE
jgi:hypothetical protein